MSQTNRIRKAKAGPLHCPICGVVADPIARPFCSKRCADIDLGYWIQGKYAVPAVDAADDTMVDSMIAEMKAAQAKSDQA